MGAPSGALKDRVSPKSHNQKGREKMAGYNGYSKSNNAVYAEYNGQYPATKAVQIVAEVTGLKKALVRKIIKSIETNEYHHTSKYYNTTYYYDTENLVAMLNAVKSRGEFKFEDYDWQGIYDQELQDYEDGVYKFCDITLTIDEVLDDNKN